MWLAPMTMRGAAAMLVRMLWTDLVDVLRSGRQSASNAAVLEGMIKPIRRARLGRSRDRRAQKPKLLKLAPTVAPDELVDEELELLRAIASDPRGAARIKTSVAAWRLVDAGAITLDPPPPRPYEARVPWRPGSMDRRPWTARATELGRAIAARRT